VIAMMKAHDLREMSVEELQGLVSEKSEELLNLRMQLKMRRLDNPLQVRAARRELAVIKTVINEKTSGR
jgi:large subunit ribosomal protein L29